MIATIRGIVEIEKAKSDRAMAKALREKATASEERNNLAGVKKKNEQDISANRALD